jgi:hypothetical protein
MDPATLAMIGQFGGSLLGNIFGGGARDDEAEARRKALEAILGADAEAEQTNIAGQGVGNQIQALEAMRNVYQSGGMDPAAKAAQSEAMTDVGRAERGTRGALTQNFAMRGAGGSGTELAAQLQNQQGGADRNAHAATRAAGDASIRALEAMRSAGGLGGQIRGQEDAFAEFNAAQRLRKAGMTAGAYGNDAAAAGDEAARQGNLWAGIGTGVGAGSSLLKKPEEEEPELLNSVGPYAR